MVLKLSPAKVNLHLAVLRKREDGYHDIATLMQRVSLYDEMAFSLAGSGVVVRCPDSFLPEDENNIICRAARVCFSRLAYDKGVIITVKKRIPIAAGLGGGSSNAATTLVTINEMLGNRLSGDELIGIGKELGADVPFFIFGKTAWAFGIGDLLVEAKDVPPLWFVLVNPGFSVSTKAVYESLNLRLTKDSINYSIPTFRIGLDFIEGLRNDLEEVTLNLHPALNQFKKDMVNSGALGALMSGSGPTVFGIFRSEEEASRAKEGMTAKAMGKWSVYLAQSI
jgi:4-diphosphocytidyl-2-C-methyl-D-erythritol kinase